MRKVSFSELNTFWMCPRKHELEYKKQIKPKVEDIKLFEGRLMHALLKEIYKPERSISEILDEEYKRYFSLLKREDKKQEFDEKFARIRACFDIYLAEVASSDVEKYDVLEVESDIEVEIDDFILEGKIDAIFKEKQKGTLYIVEHKYRSDISDELVFLDFQISIYTMALIGEFKTILPTLYNVIKKPAFRLKQGEDLTEFELRVKEALKERKDEFFIRRIYSRSKRQLEVSLRQIRDTLKVINSVNYRNVGEHCLYMCPYKEICLFEDEHIIKEKFVLENQQDAPRLADIKFSGEKGG